MNTLKTFCAAALPACIALIAAPVLAQNTTSLTHTLVLEDLDSTNGTRVNGFRCKIQMLSDGDVVKIGATQFRFDAS